MRSEVHTIYNSGDRSLTVRLEPVGLQDVVSPEQSICAFAIGEAQPRLEVQRGADLVVITVPSGVDSFLSTEHPCSPPPKAASYLNRFRLETMGVAQKTCALFGWVTAARHCRVLSDAPSWPRRRVRAAIKSYGSFARETGDHLDAAPPAECVSAHDVLLRAHACVAGYGDPSELARTALLHVAERGCDLPRDLPLLDSQRWSAPDVQAEARWIRRVLQAIRSIEIALAWGELMGPRRSSAKLYKLLEDTSWLHEAEDFLDAVFTGDEFHPNGLQSILA
ncbi:MAG: hypothetical protein AB7S68_15380 [Polyangiaceae bacterium]